MTEIVINKKNFKVNGGKPFELPEMTLKKHETILNKLATEKDQFTPLEYTKEIQKEMVLYTLREIDNSVTMEGIENNLHPSEFTDLSDAVWEAGRTDDESKFRIGESKYKKKKVG